MRITVLSKIKGLLAAALIAGAVVSCENEKPEFVVPTDHYYPFFIESYIPDTLTVTAGDSVILQFRTYPYNILTKRDSVTIEIKDINDADYEYVRPQLPPKLGKDSIWSLPVHILKGVKNNDAVRLKVTDKLADTVWRSAPIVLHKVRKSIENVTVDTLAFREGSTATFKVRTTPADLLRKLPKDSITIVDAKGDRCEYAQISSKFLDDGIWELELNIRYPMATGDIIALKVSDPDTVMYSAPVALKIIPKPDLGYLSLKIVSDSICGLLTGGRATVRFRTEPWNLLFDENNTMSLTDINGGTPTSIGLNSKVFESEDSCWTLKIKIPDASVTSYDLRVRITHPDTTMLSTPVRIERVSPSISFIRTTGSNRMDYNSNTKTYSYCMPTVTDFSNQEFLFNHDGDKVTIGDSLLLTGQVNILDARKPFTVSVWKYDVHQDFTVKLYNTGLPVVRINTHGKTVTRRDTWVYYTTIRIEMPDGTVNYESDSLSLKGRGNGTWTETNKKPYALKLNSKAKILGMHKQKRWCLLANYKDRTLLRNDAALWLSRHTHMPYTVSGRYVELVWNGNHMGNYYLCEQIRIDNNRVDIAEPNLSDPENGGMLVLIDDFLDYTSSDRQDKSPMVGFRSTGSDNRYKLPYVLKDPDEDESGNLLTSSSPTYQHLFNYVKEMEDAIYGLKNDPNSDWQQYLDIDRAVDYVLIQEMTMNHDSYNTWPKAGPHSAYLYKDAGGKLCYGPVWDFDYHTFTLYSDAAYSSGSSSENPRLRQWELLKMDNKGNNKYYFADLVKYDPVFKAKLLERWNEYKYVWKNGLPDYIDMMADSIRLSESYNDTRWAENKSLTNYRQNGDYNLTFDQAVEAMKTAFYRRWDWIDQNLPNLCK